ARNEARLATARALLASALSRLDTDPQRSLALALQAARLEQTSDVGDVLRSALVRAPLRLVLQANGGALARAMVSPDDRLVLASGRDGNARLFDARTGHLVHLLHQSGPITDVRFDRRGTLVVTASTDGTAGVWQASSGRRLSLLHHGGPVSDVSFSPHGELVATPR